MKRDENRINKEKETGPFIPSPLLPITPDHRWFSQHSSPQSPFCCLLVFQLPNSSIPSEPLSLSPTSAVDIHIHFFRRRLNLHKVHVQMCVLVQILSQNVSNWLEVFDTHARFIRTPVYWSYAQNVGIECSWISKLARTIGSKDWLVQPRNCQKSLRKILEILRVENSISWWFAPPNAFICAVRMIANGLL